MAMRSKNFLLTVPAGPQTGRFDKVNLKLAVSEALSAAPASRFAWRYQPPTMAKFVVAMELGADEAAPADEVPNEPTTPVLYRGPNPLFQCLQPRRNPLFQCLQRPAWHQGNVENDDTKHFHVAVSLDKKTSLAWMKNEFRVFMLENWSLAVNVSLHTEYWTALRYLYVPTERKPRDRLDPDIKFLSEGIIDWDEEACSDYNSKKNLTSTKEKLRLSRDGGNESKPKLTVANVIDVIVEHKFDSVPELLAWGKKQEQEWAHTLKPIINAHPDR